ncbi:MAG: protein kinase, partial [Candidatus Acidiferrales bacterium]
MAPNGGVSMIGKTLSHYRVVEKIGAGGMGEVYRARDEHLGRDVAIKVLPAGTLADEAIRKRFRKEALALSKLNHPNIATVHDFDTQDGVDFLVMELVEGVTLSDKLAVGPLPEKEISRLGGQVAEGLVAAHERRVVHRDLKPANLRVTPDGRLKILDFGLAKLVRPDVASATATTESFTETQAAAGTLPYMAPEQLRGEGVDARTDIYALGTVLYEMATGRRPFDARVPTALVADIQTKPPPPPRQFKADLSPRLENIILKALEKEPEDRYQSAKEVEVDLRRLGTPGSAAAVLSARRPATRQRMVLAVGVSLVALLAVLVGLNVGGLRERLLGGVAPGQITSIAVLPFENLGGDPDAEYLSNGISESLINKLSKLGSLRVIPWSSVSGFKQNPDPQMAREKLDVRAVLMGRVRQRGDELIISVELIDTEEKRQLWGEQYNRPMTAIFSVQEEIAREISSNLRLQLTGEEESGLASRGTKSAQAYEAYLRGHYLWHRFSPEGWEQSVRYFRQAIDSDPDYALAHAWLAKSYFLLVTLGGRPHEELYPQAKEAAEKALELDDLLADAHATMGAFKWQLEWDWTGADADMQRALDLEPNNPAVLSEYSAYLVCMGRFEEARLQLAKARELDPLNLVIHKNIAWLSYVEREFDRAIEGYRRVVEMDPTHIATRRELSWTYREKGMVEEAIHEAETAWSLSSETDYYSFASLGAAYATAGNRKKALQIVTTLEKELSKGRATWLDIAFVYVALEDNEKALAALEKGLEERVPLMFALKVYP